MKDSLTCAIRNSSDKSDIPWTSAKRTLYFSFFSLKLKIEITFQVLYLSNKAYEPSINIYG